MLTAEQLEIRKTGLGGSDIAAALGLNPYKTRYELYLEKAGRIDPVNLDDSDLVQFGNMIEKQVAEFYTHKTGIKLRKKNQTIRHKKYPWILANIDRKVERVIKGVEIKNVSWQAAKSWGKDGSQDVAEYYVPQPMTYMLVLDYPAWDVAAYFGGADLRIYPLDRDREWDELIIEESHDFWHNHVLKEIPPEIDYNHPSTESALKRLYPGTNGQTIQLPEELEYWNTVRQEAAEKAKYYEGVVNGCKNHFLEAMGDNALGELPSGATITRSLIKKKEYTVPASQYMTSRFKKGK